MNELKFTLTIEEANTVLAALSKLSFEAVAGLIGKLKEQATTQLAPQEAPAEDVKSLKKSK